MIENPLSREALILLNNVVLATLIVLVGAPYYNAVVTPLMAGLLFLAAIGPMVPWRRMPGARLARRFVWLGVLAGIAARLAGGGAAATLGTAGGVLLIVASLRDMLSAVAARQPERARISRDLWLFLIAWST